MLYWVFITGQIWVFKGLKYVSGIVRFDIKDCNLELVCGHNTTWDIIF